MIRRLLALGGAAVLAASVAAVPHFSSAQSATGWPTFHGDIARDGASSLSGPTTSFLLNQVDIGTAVTDSPVVSSNGIAYVGAANGGIYSINPTANPISQLLYTTGGKVESTPTLSSDGKTLFVGSDDGSVYAINTSTGAKLWSQPLGAPIHSSPVLSPDGSTVYVAATVGGVYALSTSSGAQIWKSGSFGAVAGSPALSQDGSVLYVARSDAGIMLGMAATGSQAGKALSVYYLDGNAYGSPAIDPGGNLYVTTTVGSLISFAPGSSTPRWTVTQQTSTPSLTTPAIANGMVYDGNSNGYLYGVTTSGTQQWQQKTGGGVNSSPAVTAGNNIVYVGSDDGKIYAFSSAGQQVWSMTIGAGVEASPAIGPDGSVWVASGNSVFRFNASTPPPILQTPTAGPTSTPGPTATPSPTTVSTAIAITSIKAKVAPGQTQSITAHTSPNTLVHFRVQYPNGDHKSHGATTNASGNVTFSFTQPASKIQHSHFTATVTAKTSTASTSRTYKILFGKLDVSVEPRSQTPGHVVNIYVHAKKGTKVVANLLFPNHTFKHFGPQKAGAKGFGHWKYKVSSKTGKGKVTVRGSTQGLHPNYSSTSSFTIK